MHAYIMLDQAPLLPSLCSFFLTALVDILYYLSLSSFDKATKTKHVIHFFLNRSYFLKQ